MKQDRLLQIEKYVKTHGKASIEELRQYFMVSPITIRRALKELTDKGALAKIYGGVVSYPVSTAAKPVPVDMGSMGLIAASLINDGDSIYLDEGASIAQIIPFLSQKKNVTIITNSLPALNAAAGNYSLNVICPGGKLQPATNTLVGNLKDTFHCRKAFISAESASAEYGVANSNFYNGVAKRLAIESSEEAYLVMDHQGFYSQSYNTFAKLNAFVHIISDSPPPQNIVDYCMENNILISCGS